MCVRSESHKVIYVISSNVHILGQLFKDKMHFLPENNKWYFLFFTDGCQLKLSWQWQRKYPTPERSRCVSGPAGQAAHCAWCVVWKWAAGSILQPGQCERHRAVNFMWVTWVLLLSSSLQGSQFSKHGSVFDSSQMGTFTAASSSSSDVYVKDSWAPEKVADLNAEASHRQIQDLSSGRFLANTITSILTWQLFTLEGSCQDISDPGSQISEMVLWPSHLLMDIHQHLRESEVWSILFCLHWNVTQCVKVSVSHIRWSSVLNPTTWSFIESSVPACGPSWWTGWWR